MILTPADPPAAQQRGKHQQKKRQKKQREEEEEEEEEVRSRPGAKGNPSSGHSLRLIVFQSVRR